MADLNAALRLCGEMVTAAAKENIYSKHIVDNGMLGNSVTYRIEGDSVIIGTPLIYGA